MTTKPNNPPAFPRSAAFGDGCHDWGQEGMSLRDYFAGQIACGMAAFSGTSGVSYCPTDIAGRSYTIADAMLAAREVSDE